MRRRRVPAPRVIVGLGYMAAGLLAALALGKAAAWAYPVGRGNIWLVTYVSMGVVVLLALRPVVAALRGNRR